MLDDNPPFGSTSNRGRPRISWWFSLIFIIAVIAVVGTVIYATLLGQHSVSGTVVNAYTLSPVPNATVSSDSRTATTDSNGRFKIGGDATAISATKEGYAAIQATVPPGGEPFQIRLRPNVLQGVVLNSATHEPVAGATVTLSVNAKAVGSATTDPSGKYAFSNVPEGASIEINAADFAVAKRTIDKQTQIDVQIAPDVLVGTVTDEHGKPIAGAVVAADNVYTNTGSDGTYRLKGVSGTGTAYFKAAGYAATSKPLDPALHLDASLSPIQVKAIYASANTASNPQSLGNLIHIADTTEVNALVVDLKDSTGHVYFDTKVPLAHEIGAVSPILDPATLVATLHQHHIYAIARIVVFEDPILAEARPDWAIHDSSTGGLWRTWNRLAWVNAHNKDVWDYDVAIAKEAAEFGFDEIQLDYIRFPTDGPLNRAEYGVPHNDQTRPEAISDFLTEMYAAIAPTHAYLAADVFGLTMWETGDGQIGQNLETLAKHLDYVCPMVYPSHFSSGSMGFDIPNDHPFEVVLWSLQNGEKRIPQDKAKIRPWLQDFSLGQGIAYGPDQVKREIDAANTFGASGWMLWNAGNQYHTDALASNGST